MRLSAVLVEGGGEAPEGAAAQAAMAEPSGQPRALGPDQGTKASGTQAGSERPPPSRQGGKAHLVPPRAKLKSNVEVREGLLDRMHGAAAQISEAGLCKERQRVAQGVAQVANSAGPVLVAEPWDRLRGRTVEGKSEFDVTVPANEERLRKQAALALVQHWAPDCSTFSRAMEKPIRGAPEGKGPLPMRSKQHPEGLPWPALKERFPKPGIAKLVKEKLALHNFLAGMAAAEALKAAKQGRFIIIENPAQSYMWDLTAFRELAALPGMVWVTLHSCAFGGQRRKYTAFLTNVPGLKEACGRHCTAREEEAPCDYSGRPHKSWRPIWKDGYATTVTQPESQYPEPLCEALAGCIALCPGAAPELASKLPFVFLEVYSGPNAPLTRAVRRAMGADQHEPSVAEGGALPPRS